MIGDFVLGIPYITWGLSLLNDLDSATNAEVALGWDFSVSQFPNSKDLGFSRKKVLKTNPKGREFLIFYKFYNFFFNFRDPGDFSRDQI